MSRMEDVNENDIMFGQPVEVNRRGEMPRSNQMSDDEIIKKSLEAMHRKAPVEQQTSVNQPEPLMNAAMNQDLASALNAIATQSDNSNYYKIEGLPSRGFLYPEGTEIIARPLKVIEIKKLSSLATGNADFIINDILKRTVRGINVDDILIADKMYIILWLRANSFKDSSYRVDFHCDQCDTDSNFHFDIDNIEVQYLQNYDSNKILKLGNQDNVTIKFLRISDNTKIQRFIEINKGTFLEIDPELVTIAAMISTINGSQKSLLDKYNYVLSLNPQDFSLLVSFIDKFGMGLKPYMNVKCSKCGGVSQLAITFQPEFFFPSYKFE